MAAKLDSAEFKKVKNQCYRDYSDGFYVYCPPSSHQSTQDGVDYISVMQAGLSSLKAGLKTIITILISFGGIILIIKRKNGLMSLTLLWIS